MTDNSSVFYSHKRTMPWYMTAALTAGVAIAIAAAAASDAWLMAVATVALLGILWAMFGVLRVTVTDTHVNIQYGLFGPTIPITAITSAEATDYDWKRFGGWGIRRSLGGEWIYNMPGDKGQAVRIRWHDAKARARVTLYGTPQPEPLAEAIARARSAATGKSPDPGQEK